MKHTNLLFFADVCGEAATSALCLRLPALKRAHKADFVFVNAENNDNTGFCHPALCEALFEAGADVLTGGNHTLKLPEMAPFLDNHPRALRPENLAGTHPGQGHVIVEKDGVRVLVLNLLGQAFLSGANNPFFITEELLKKADGKYDLAVCDFHAEATAEKGAFFHAFDGKFSAVVGTHTHVPTADLQISRKGTAFITDLGMCGAKRSVLGVKCEESIRRFVTGEKLRYVPAAGPVVLMGAVFTFDETGACTRACRIEEVV